MHFSLQFVEKTHCTTASATAADRIVSVFRFNPYATDCVVEALPCPAQSAKMLPSPSYMYYERQRRPAPTPAALYVRPTSEFTAPLPGTLHAPALAATVGFVAYPADGFFVEPPRLPKERMVRVFIGQLPYQVTDMQLNWLCQTFAGCTVHFPERIMKRQDDKTNRTHGVEAGAKLPTGCIHAYCDPALADTLMQALHKRVLVDDTGVWYARTQAEARTLNDYCTVLKGDKKKRPFNRPYDTVVAQYASSSYVPAHAPTAFHP